MNSDIQGLLGGTDAPTPYAYELERVKSVQMPSLKQRLDLAVAQAEAKLADVKRARELFDKNPDLEELLNIMQRGRF